jgi:ubiquinone/menaquinone biosynthesis C-methylase UbiE
MIDDLQRSYDSVAEDYARNFCDELDHKPFDCKMLDWLIEKAGTGGSFCDLGCGPGQIARYLHDRKVDACGIDLSDEMVRQAQRLNPNILFRQGNMSSLDNVPDDSFAGIAAFYSIIHIPRHQLVQTLRQLRRVLRSSGVLLLTFHIGKEVVRRDEWWDKSVCLDFYFFETGEMKAFLREANFVLEEVIERDPYPEVEYPSRRAYVFARKVG